MPKPVKQPKSVKHVNPIHERTHKQGKELIEGEHTTSRDRKIAEIRSDPRVIKIDDLSQVVTCENGNECMVGEDGSVINMTTGKKIGVEKNCCDDELDGGGGRRKRTRKGKKSKRKGKKSRRKARKGKQSRRKGKQSRRKGKKSRRKGRKRRRRRTKKH